MLAPRWQEWNRTDTHAPAYVRRFGSPTILVDGRDIVGDAGQEGAGACRIYGDACGRATGVPPIEPITTALLAAENASVGAPAAAAAPRSAWKNSLAALPAVGLVLLPKLTCPLCWPAYTALLSAMGVGFVNYTPYLLPLMTMFLVLTLAMLGYRARTRHGFGPFALGCIATAIILVGKFWLDSDTALYGGVALLVGASLWNAWPRKISEAPCPACIPAGSPVERTAAN